MELGMIGLGRMGANMATRLLRGGHRVVTFDVAPGKAQELAQAEGAVAASSLDAVIAQLAPPRIVWLMLPAGKITEDVLDDLLARLAPGDTVIEGGNSNFKDSKRRAEKCAARQIAFLDCGTSGGVWGLDLGYCLMIGGAKRAFDFCAPIFETLAPAQGFAYVGASGAGHFAKMVHNGIEYAMMQAYGESFEIMQAAPFTLDLRQIAALWNHGAVARSWLLELTARAFAQEGTALEEIRGYVEDSGEGRWTVQQALETNVPAPAITMALMTRFASRQRESFSAQTTAAIRNQFGGHPLKRE